MPSAPASRAALVSASSMLGTRTNGAQSVPAVAAIIVRAWSRVHRPVLSIDQHEVGTGGRDGLRHHRRRNQRHDAAEHVGRSQPLLQEHDVFLTMPLPSDPPRGSPFRRTHGDTTANSSPKGNGSRLRRTMAEASRPVGTGTFRGSATEGGVLHRDVGRGVAADLLAYILNLGRWRRCTTRDPNRGEHRTPAGSRGRRPPQESARQDQAVRAARQRRQELESAGLPVDLGGAARSSGCTTATSRLGAAAQTTRYP